MRKRTKAVFAMGIGLLGFLLVAAVTFYFWAWVPIKRSSDPVWWESASQTERADLCHILIDRNLDGHDVWLNLRHVGNKASIPRLLKQFEDAGAILEDGGWCVADHCLDALRSITGHDAGKTPGAWRSWWEETGSKLPEDQFHPRVAKRDSAPPIADAFPGSIPTIPLPTPQSDIFQQVARRLAPARPPTKGLHGDGRTQVKSAG